MITTILYGILGFLLGVLTFLAAPILANSAPMNTRVRVGEWYFGLSMKSYRRVMCLVTPHNDMDLYASSWDTEAQGEQVTNGEHPDTYQDPKGSVARCQNIPFTIAFTDQASVIHPLDAKVSRAKHELEKEGREWMEFVKGQEESAVKVVAHNAHVALADQLEGVNLQEARRVLNESHQPGDPHRTKADVRKSQDGFNDHDVLSMMVIIIACMAGALGAWIIYSNTGDSESAVTLPMTLGGWFL